MIKSGGVYIHCETQSGKVSIRFTPSKVEAERLAAQHEGKYKYFAASERDLVAAKLPTSVLLGVIRLSDPRTRIKVVKNRRRIERKVWNIMATMTAEETKLAEAEAKAKREVEANERKEAQKTKKAEAEQVKAEKAKVAAAAKEAKAKLLADKKAAKDAKVAEAKAAKPAGNGRMPRIDQNEVVTLLVKGNPKREGSEAYGRFAFYKDGMTVGEFIKAGGTMADVVWDLGHRLIALAQPEKPVTNHVDAGASQEQQASA